MARRITRWLCGSLCLIFLPGCVPQPVYNSGDGQERPGSYRKDASGSGSEESASRVSQASPRIEFPSPSARPVDPAQIDTREAYQLGIASYYGEKFHGRRTANGDVFNMYRLTAAHRVLPLGTRIKVTNLNNGRWVEVEVNDRGPFVEGRILDLSFAAALELEMVSDGTAQVMIEIVEAVD